MSYIGCIVTAEVKCGTEITQHSHYKKCNEKLLYLQKNSHLKRL